jgi:cytoskeletal protein CcmA (bactofilin family)
MFRPFALGFLILLLNLTSHAQDNRGRPTEDTVTLDLGSDHFASGRNITVSRPVDGDLLAAGGSVVLDSNVGGDAVVAGSRVRIDGNFSQRVYAAGGQVLVNGTVARNARLAGGNIELAPSSRIDGGVSIGAGEARVSGSIRGYLQSAAGSLYINGPIGGDVEAIGGRIELGPNTRIAGRLRYRSRKEVKRDPAAQVLGGIEQVQPPQRRAPARGRGLVVFAIWTLGLMLLITVLLLAVPGFVVNVTEMLESRPGASALLGFAILVCTPVAVVLLLITLIGIPLGLLCIATYLILLAIGYLSAATALGGVFLRRLRLGTVSTTSWRIGAGIAGILILAVLGQIPLLGGLVVFAALLMGMGAIGLQVNRSLRPAH